MNKFNIYLIGVGGQGIGLLSEIITRAVNHSGQKVKTVDTHGLAQRGGTVKSQIRIGNIYSPLISAGQADLVIALEENEALRALNSHLKDHGKLLYYQTQYQPLFIRQGEEQIDLTATIKEKCAQRQITLYQAFKADLADPRQENIVVLAAIAKNGLIPGVCKNDYLQALDDLMEQQMLAKNLQLFQKEAEPL